MTKIMATASLPFCVFIRIPPSAGSLGFYGKNYYIATTSLERTSQPQLYDTTLNVTRINMGAAIISIDELRVCS
ncbi:MAG: hypothetical protein ABIJ53_02405 [Verrucomicrobiota bacterium]